MPSFREFNLYIQEVVRDRLIRRPVFNRTVPYLSHLQVYRHFLKNGKFVAFSAPPPPISTDRSYCWLDPLSPAARPPVVSGGGGSVADDGGAGARLVVR